jgi:hypothetical protein
MRRSAKTTLTVEREIGGKGELRRYGAVCSARIGRGESSDTPVMRVVRKRSRLAKKSTHDELAQSTPGTRGIKKYRSSPKLELGMIDKVSDPWASSQHHSHDQDRKQHEDEALPGITVTEPRLDACTGLPPPLST